MIEQRGRIHPNIRAVYKDAPLSDQRFRATVEDQAREVVNRINNDYSNLIYEVRLLITSNQALRDEVERLSKALKTKGFAQNDREQDKKAKTTK